MKIKLFLFLTPHRMGRSVTRAARITDARGGHYLWLDQQPFDHQCRSRHPKSQKGKVESHRHGASTNQLGSQLSKLSGNAHLSGSPQSFLAETPESSQNLPSEQSKI